MLASYLNLYYRYTNHDLIPLHLFYKCASQQEKSIMAPETQRARNSKVLRTRTQI